MATNTRKGLKSAGKRTSKTPRESTTSNGLLNSATSTSEPHLQETTTAVEQVRKRAYELFLAHGGIHGNDLGDWFAAERELTGNSPRV